MSPSTIRGLLYAVLALLLILHNDLWLWDDPSLVLGLPVGLVYHIAFAIAASILMFLLVRFAWPSWLEVQEDEEEG